jgi:hypothetical protein
MPNYAFQRKFRKMAITIGVALLYCGYYSWTELKYAVAGQTTTAIVTKAQRYTERDKYGSTKSISIEYQFTEPSGASRRETDNLPLPDSPPNLGNRIDIQFLPNTPGASRFADHDHLSAAAAFLTLLTATLIFIAINLATQVPITPPNSSTSPTPNHQTASNAPTH